jgi:hypothetical protein
MVIKADESCQVPWEVWRSFENTAGPDEQVSISIRLWRFLMKMERGHENITVRLALSIFERTRVNQVCQY